MSYYAPILSTPVIAGWQGIFTSAQQAAEGLQRKRSKVTPDYRLNSPTIHKQTQDNQKMRI